LQQAALEDRAGETWLQAQGLADAPRLARAIKVQPGWEAAVEVVLGHWLQSVLVGKDSRYDRALGALENTSLDLIENQSGGVKPRKGSLAEKVEAPDAVIGWLNGIGIAGTLDEAWAGRGDLDVSGSVITADGEWIGKNWVRVARGQTEQDSMLARERTIERLHKDVGELSAKAEELSAEIRLARDAATDIENRMQSAQAEGNALHRKRNEISGRLESRHSNLKLMTERKQTVVEESQQLRQQVEEDESAVREARAGLEKFLARMTGLKEQREALDAQRSRLMARREKAREGLGSSRDRRHDLALKAESRRASLDSLSQSLERMDTQLSQLQQRYIGLSEQLARVDQPDKLHAAEMESLLGRRVETESRLGAARAHLQGLENEYREKDAERQKAIQQCDAIRQDLERARLKQQEVELNARAIQRQVDELGGDVEKLATDLADGAESEDWDAQLEQLQVKISRLEPVNLAAIQEFEEEQKRKEYLDAQNDDLCSALNTLENAIAKIDRKTRTRFKETFELVNKGVQELFPRLFGGGHAYLELTGEDLLTTGVSIMAQPPGKRVSSLHLLSGGEKALTAVSFVFAIFRLNPSPFCLLDEVDAPLDDANVVRFSNMVKEMSATVQFVFVTHNKITMEMASQMSGVTMREPGVSRLVQVDIDEAAALAAS